MGDFLYSVQLLNLVKSVDAGREASVETEDLIHHDSRQRKVVEELCQQSPHIRVPVLSQAFIVEAVNLSDLPALVISSQDRDSVRVSDLQSNEKSHGLNGVVASIDIVSHEQVVGIRKLTSKPEEFLQVVELPVDVATDGHRGSDWLDIRFLDEDIFSLVAETLDLRLSKWRALKQLCYDLVLIGDLMEVYLGLPCFRSGCHYYLFFC